MHGVAVADHIASRSDGRFKIEEGSLYPALHRLQAKGYVTWEWVRTEEGKRAKYYELTKGGRRAMKRELKGWIANTRAMLTLLDLKAEEVG
jgi:DNA-binding PadR family transcriptional regulator